MNSFKYYAPVALHVGRGCLEENAGLITRQGKRGFVLTSRFAPGYHNLALEDACRVLSQQGTEFEVCDEVEENPSVESVRQIADRMLDYRPDFLLAIGGGSALDTAKAANVLLRWPKGADAYRIFYDGSPAGTGSKSEGLLPLIGIPTTAGSGSEVAGYAVLTRRDRQTKQRMNQLSFFHDALLDARYIENSPGWLIDVGALDALAHGLESCLNVANSFTSRMLAGFGLQLFRGYKDRLLEQALTGEDYENMLLAASVQGMAVVQSSTTLPHGMGYVLTHEKGLPHGFASCVTLAEYLKLFREPAHQRTVREILTQSGFADAEELEDYLARIIVRNLSFTVTEEELRRWAEDFSREKGRLDRNPEPVSRADIEGMYRRSLERLGALKRE